MLAAAGAELQDASAMQQQVTVTATSRPRRALPRGAAINGAGSVRRC